MINNKYESVINPSNITVSDSQDQLECTLNKQIDCYWADIIQQIKPKIMDQDTMDNSNMSISIPECKKKSFVINNIIEQSRSPILSGTIENNQSISNKSQQHQKEQHQINNKSKLIQEEKHQINNKSKQIQEEKHQISNKSQQIQEEKHHINNKSIQIQEEKHHIINKSNQIQEKKHHINNKSNQIQEEKHQISNKSQQIQEEKHHINNKSNQIQEEKNQISNKSQQNQEEKHQINNKSKQIQEEKHHISNKSQQIQEEKHHIMNKSIQIQEEKHQISNKSQQIQEEKHHINNKSQQIQEEKHQIKNKSQQIQEEKHQISNKSQQNQEEKHQINNKSKQIQEEKHQINNKSIQIQEEKNQTNNKSKLIQEEKNQISNKDHKSEDYIDQSQKIVITKLQLYKKHQYNRQNIIQKTPLLSQQSEEDKKIYEKIYNKPTGKNHVINQLISKDQRLPNLENNRLIIYSTGCKFNDKSYYQSIKTSIDMNIIECKPPVIIKVSVLFKDINRVYCYKPRIITTYNIWNKLIIAGNTIKSFNLSHKLSTTIKIETVLNNSYTNHKKLLALGIYLNS